MGSLIITLASLALAQEPPPSSDGTEAERRHVAVVVGLADYENLPSAVALDFARSDAVVVERALREGAGFDKTFLLTGRQATRAAIRDLFRQDVAQHVGPDDFLVFYFVGHGLGADFGIPTLLAYDSTLENGQRDGLELQGFAQDLHTWTRAGTTLLVTDAIHSNQLDGIYFYGPAADEWPSLPYGTMVLSASSAAMPSKDGAFGPVFAESIAGSADANGDQTVTASELVAHLNNHFGSLPQQPVAAGDYDPDMVLAHDVQGFEGSATEPVYDHEVWSAKFVFTEGGAHSVACRDAPVKACEPSCYVRDFAAGPCELTTVIDGEEVRGRVVALLPGRYLCGRKDGKLTCESPRVEAGEGPK
jgi:hypothetical protein